MEVTSNYISGILSVHFVVLLDLCDFDFRLKMPKGCHVIRLITSNWLLWRSFKQPSLIQEKSIHGVGENLDSLAWAFLPVLSRPWALWEHVSLLCTKMSSFYGPDGLHRNVSLFLTYRSWQNQLNQLWNMANASGSTDGNLVTILSFQVHVVHERGIQI